MRGNSVEIYITSPSHFIYEFRYEQSNQARGERQARGACREDGAAVVEGEADAGGVRAAAARVRPVRRGPLGADRPRGDQQDHGRAGGVAHGDADVGADRGAQDEGQANRVRGVPRASLPESRRGADQGGTQDHLQPHRQAGRRGHRLRGDQAARPHLQRRLQRRRPPRDAALHLRQPRNHLQRVPHLRRVLRHRLQVLQEVIPPCMINPYHPPPPFPPAFLHLPPRPLRCNHIMSGNNNNSKKEYIDIPLKVEETPLHLYERFTAYKFPADPVDVGFDFITRLDEAVRSSDAKNELLSLYLNYFEPANAQRFVDKDWPASYEIEAKYEDRDFNAKVQTLYNELRLRHQFEKLKTYDNARVLEVAEEAWDNYESILERESREVVLPAIVAWEILENFLFQLSRYYTVTLAWADRSQVEDAVFDLKRSRKLLQNLVALTAREDIRNLPSRENFGYFAVVALATLEVYEGNYQAALDTLSRISLGDLSIYSRSIGVLLTLFLTASFAYFMLEQYKESARLAEMFLVFFQKNKKYFSGIIGEGIVTRQFEKLAGLLCLSYIFLEEKPKTVILEVFKATTIKLKDKQHRERLADKYAKLRQNDGPTFLKLFQHCSLPSVRPNPEAIQELVLVRFRALQTITLNTILQHYTQISVRKVAALLRISEQEVLARMESFNKVSTGNAAWDRSIMEPLLSQTRKVHVEVSEGVIKLDTDETNAHEGFNEWEQYRKEISWLTEKVNSL